MQNSYDIILAGAGASGILTAHGILKQNPQLKIALIEKETTLGGRLRSLDLEQLDLTQNNLEVQAKNPFGFGLNMASKSICEFWQDRFKQDPNLEVIPQVGKKQQKSCAIISAGRITQTSIDSLMSVDGFRALGGAAAGKEWKSFQEHWENEPQKSFGAMWKNGQKSAGAIVFKHYGHLLGISDLWHSYLPAIKQRASAYSAPHFNDHWPEVIHKTLEHLDTNHLDIFTDSQIFKAQFLDDTWAVESKKGTFVSKKLIVCQSPWEALHWLPKQFFPKELLALTMKSTPTSIVILSVITKKPIPDNIDDVSIVPAEDVQIIKSSEYELSLQATIDYEHSLQSESVAKAVRRLRRSLKKFCEVHPNVLVLRDHIGLLPVAWTPSTHAESAELQKQLRYESINQDHLIFCGDTYGQHFDGNLNFIHSVSAAIDTVTK